MDDVREMTLEAIAKAMADPVRNKIFNAVSEATLGGGTEVEDPGGITVRQLSEQVREPRRRVRYHLDALRKQGLVDAVKEARHSGVVEHYFAALRLPVLGSDDLARLSQIQQKGVFLGCLRLIIASAAHGLDSGAAVRRQGWAAIRRPVEVDQQGWREIADLHIRFLEEVEELDARARARLAKSEQEPIRAVSASLFFETPP